MTSRMAVMINVWTFLATMAMASASRPDATLCPLSEYIDDNEETVREFFECPGMEDPPGHVACCEERCCPMVDSVLQVSY